MAFKHREIEPKWQEFWKDNHTFKLSEDEQKENFYALDMFPYPSGQGLHVGHPEGYTATDIISRMKRSQGFNVLHPMGWDAFGLPAEQYALDTGNDPAEFTEKIYRPLNVKSILLGLVMIGKGKLIRQIPNIINGHSGYLLNWWSMIWLIRQKSLLIGAPL